MKTINEQWLNYLSLLGIDPKTLPQIQKDEMMKSFFAGASSMLELMSRVSETHSEDEAAKIFDDCMCESVKFWKDKMTPPN